MKRKIVVAVTGASGPVYAQSLLDELVTQKEVPGEIAVIFSTNAAAIWKYELENDFVETGPVKIYDNRDFNAPFASGSCLHDTMIICPCSMGTLGRIASGISDDLISRAADVMLKEHRKLILVPRETPLSLIHIENMRKVTLAGGIICPATPSFYSKPQTIGDLVKTVTGRILTLAGFETSVKGWGE